MNDLSCESCPAVAEMRCDPHQCVGREYFGEQMFHSLNTVLCLGLYKSLQTSSFTFAYVIAFLTYLTQQTFISELFAAFLTLKYQGDCPWCYCILVPRVVLLFYT